MSLLVPTWKLESFKASQVNQDREHSEWWCAKDQVFQKLLSFGGAAPAPASPVLASRQPVSPCCQLEIWPRPGKILTPSKDALNSAANLLSYQSPPTRGERCVQRVVHTGGGQDNININPPARGINVFPPPSELSLRGQPGWLTAATTAGPTAGMTT